MATSIVYVGGIGGEDGVEIADAGIWAPPGQPVDVPDACAGHPPSGTPGEEGYDPGAGLLAQVENFLPATSAAATAAPIDDVLAEVGDDPAKAAAAFAAERARPSPRKTLLTKLGAIAAQTGDSNG